MDMWVWIKSKLQETAGFSHSHVFHLAVSVFPLLIQRYVLGRLSQKGDAWGWFGEFREGAGMCRGCGAGAVVWA